MNIENMYETPQMRETFYFTNPKTRQLEPGYPEYGNVPITYIAVSEEYFIPKYKEVDGEEWVAFCDENDGERYKFESYEQAEQFLGAYHEWYAENGK